MAIFTLQHILFYQLQIYLLRKYSIFNQDVKASLTLAISNIRGLLWFYRLWPAVLTILLSIIYIGMFKPEHPLWQMLVIGTILAVGIGILSNIISAVLVRQHLIRLEGLKQYLVKLSV